MFFIEFVVMLEIVFVGSVIVLRDLVEISVNVMILIVYFLMGICVEVSFMCYIVVYEIYIMFDF